MKRFAVLAAVAILASVPATAQQAKPAAPTPAASAPAAPAAAPTAAAKFTLDTPVATLMADPAAKAVVDANLPGLSTHESYDMFKSMSLNQLSGMAPDKMTPEVMAKTRTALAAIK